MNARGIPTAAYQVLHLLSCTRWGTPPPTVGVPSLARSSAGGGYPRWGTPHWDTPQPGPMGGWYPRWSTPWSGYPPGQVWQGGTQGGVPPPSQVWWGGTRGGYPRWVPPGPGWGTPQPHLDLAGVPPPPPRCGQTDGWMNRHVWKHYFPVVLRTRSVKSNIYDIAEN